MLHARSLVTARPVNEWKAVPSFDKKAGAHGRRPCRCEPRFAGADGPVAVLPLTFFPSAAAAVPVGSYRWNERDTDDSLVDSITVEDVGTHRWRGDVQYRHQPAVHSYAADRAHEIAVPGPWVSSRKISSLHHLQQIMCTALAFRALDGGSPLAFRAHECACWSENHWFRHVLGSSKTTSGVI